VIQLWQPNAALSNTVEVLVNKQRNGALGSFMLTFLKKYGRFENHAPEFFATSEAG
jgi:replicative DNA helicase